VAPETHGTLRKVLTGQIYSTSQHTCYTANFTLKVVIIKNRIFKFLLREYLMLFCILVVIYNYFRMEVPVTQLNDNFFRAIGDESMLITAGTKDHFNTMTASWGTCGVLWNMPVAICFVRPQRYTFQFMEKHGFFTLSFLGEEHMDIMQFCGSYSGRDVDKIATTGLKPLVTKTGNIYFEQARLVLECRKIYADRINPDRFIIPEIKDSIYPARDYHKFYIGEIISCLVKD